MKLPLDQRTALANKILGHYWPCEYWSRDEQMFACAEGWCLSVYDDDRIYRWYKGVTEFNSDKEAIAYVLQRAQEGSPLHCRAVVLHAASVIKSPHA